MDAVLSSLPHLVFKETKTKLIGTIKESSLYSNRSFRSVAYKGSSYSNSAAKNAIATDFFYSVVWGR